MHSKKIPIAIGGGIIAAVILAAIFLIPKDRTTPSNTKDNPNAIASNDNSDNPNNPSNTKDTPNNVNTSQPAVVNNTSSTERQKEAEARYNAAINYANGHTNPEELEGVIKYFTDTLPYLRGTENYENWARERIDKYKGDLQRVMDTRFDEVATATSNEINVSNNYRDAINILDKAVNMFDNPDWRRRITTKKDELFREADMKARQIFNTATELESRQKYQDAIKSLNTVQSFGIPELEREAQGRISQISQKIKAEKDVERELIRQKEKLFTAKRVEWFIELRERKYEEVMKEASSLMAELKGTTFEDALKDMILNLKFPKTLFEDVKNVATGEIKVGDPKTRDPKTGKFKVMKDIKEIEFDYVLKNGIKFDRKFINRDTKGEISIGGVGVYLDVGGGRTTVIDAETIIRIYDLIENPRDLDTRLTQEAEINLAKGLFLFFDGEITKSERYLKDARDKGAPVDNYFFNEINKINRKLKGQGANIDQPQDNKDKPKEDKTANGLYAEYFSGIELNGGELRAMQVDDDINLNLRDESPIPGKVPKDNFSIRWTGTITFPATGRYEFTTVSDDGVRLYIENAKVIDNWSQHAAKEDKATVDGNKGEHAIKLEYFESGGPGIIQLFWNYDDKMKRLLTTGDFKVLIPQQYFTHDTGKLMIKMR